LFYPRGHCNFVAAVTYLPLPPEQQEACRCSEKLLASLAQNPTLFIVNYLAIALYSLLAIGAVLAISERVRSANEGWVRWTSTLAIIGLAVNAIVAFNHVALDSDRAAAYVKGDAALKAALTVPGALAVLDPQAWLRYGAFGVWVLVVSLLALRGGAWPKPLAYLGFGVAIAAWLVVAGEVFQGQSLVAIIAGGAAILVPIWYIWLGLRLRRAG
jgi:Domain of unknown function (DUF4386)